MNSNEIKIILPIIIALMITPAVVHAQQNSTYGPAQQPPIFGNPPDQQFLNLADG
jgi:hypothetical protein